jgi:heme A synthase
MRTIRITTTQAATGTVKTIRLKAGRRATVRIPPVHDGHVLRVSTSCGQVDIRVRVMSAQASKTREQLAQAAGALAAIGFAAAGPLLILTGLNAMHSTAAPVCDGQTMHPGDVCDIISTGGGGGSFSYQQMIARHQASGHSHLILGIILTLIDVLLLALVIRTAQRKRSASRPPATATTR